MHEAAHRRLRVEVTLYDVRTSAIIMSCSGRQRELPCEMPKTAREARVVFATDRRGAIGHICRNHHLSQSRSGSCNRVDERGVHERRTSGSPTLTAAILDLGATPTMPRPLSAAAAAPAHLRQIIQYDWRLVRPLRPEDAQASNLMLCQQSLADALQSSCTGLPFRSCDVMDAQPVCCFERRAPQRWNRSKVQGKSPPHQTLWRAPFLSNLSQIATEMPGLKLAHQVPWPLLSVQDAGSMLMVPPTQLTDRSRSMFGARSETRAIKDSNQDHCRD